MEYGNENSRNGIQLQQYASRLPQKSSQIPRPEGLVELNASTTNARAAMPPPQVPGDLKRKTLVEKAGDFPPPYSLTVLNPSNKRRQQTISRNPSFSSSTSQVPSTFHNRQISNGSISSSGTFHRPASQQHGRVSKYSGKPNSGSMNRRPASSIDTYKNTVDFETNGACNGRTQFPSHYKQSPAILSDSLVEEERAYYKKESYEKLSSEILRRPSSEREMRRQSLRDISLSTHFSQLSLKQEEPIVELIGGQRSPSKFARERSSVATITPSPSKSSRKKQPIIPFLTKDSNIRAASFDDDIHLDTFPAYELEETQKIIMARYEAERETQKEINNLLKMKVDDLESKRAQLSETNAALQIDLDKARKELEKEREILRARSIELEDASRSHKYGIQDLHRKYEQDLEEVTRQAKRDTEDKIRPLKEEISTLNLQHQGEIRELRRQLEDQIEVEKNRYREEVQGVSTQSAKTQQKLREELELKEKALEDAQRRLEQAQEQAKQVNLREQIIIQELRSKLSEASTHTISLETSSRSMRARIDFLESDCKSQSQAFADLEQKTQDAIGRAAEAHEKLRIEETLRRKLHNQVQELKGNIRVFCRIRPPLDTEGTAKIIVPDAKGESKEVEIYGPEEKSSLGTITTKKNAFTFDRVFTPSCQNLDVFGEISQLIQSALDGYNVCIFCYGQTGAGKTYTMNDMIPRAVHQIYDTAQSLVEKGWKYSMEGSFVEVYNENINDLLGKADELDKKKHEIRHDSKSCKTTITDVTTVDLDSPTKVESILRRAAANRSVAATKANERSSRGHSVFILKLIGENHISGERSEGTLNLVDLAGSERLSHSGATGERLKETQNINKSLSCLGDVIGALGQGRDGHIPYRNSKLTHLLQFSLGGNSKTLMFVMISPMQEHLSETLTSLKFATKVHNTHIGTARRQTKTRDT